MRMIFGVCAVLALAAGWYALDLSGDAQMNVFTRSLLGLALTAALALVGAVSVWAAIALKRSRLAMIGVATWAIAAPALFMGVERPGEFVLVAIFFLGNALVLLVAGTERLWRTARQP